MTPQIEWRPSYGHLVLRLGQVDVGMVSPDGGIAHRPRYQFFLNRHSTPQTAQTIESAKAILETLLQDWLSRAGLIKPNPGGQG